MAAARARSGCRPGLIKADLAMGFDTFITEETS